jgi:hypothetical protein
VLPPDRILAALVLLNQEAPKKNIVSRADPGDPRSCSFLVPTLDDRTQTVYAFPVPDSLFGERLDIASGVHEIPRDADLLVALLRVSRDFRRVRLCVVDRDRPKLMAVVSFIPDEIHEGAGPRLLSAMREVAAVADSLERQIVGLDVK